LAPAASLDSVHH